MRVSGVLLVHATSVVPECDTQCSVWLYSHTMLRLVAFTHNALSQWLAISLNLCELIMS